MAMINFKKCGNKDCQNTNTLLDGTLPKEEFYIRNDSKLGLSSYCKLCSDLNSKQNLNTIRGQQARKITTSKYAASPRGKTNKARYHASDKGIISKKNTTIYNRCKRVGVSRTEWEAIKKLQNNLCAICGSPEVVMDWRNGNTKDLAMDHNHVTGKFRGLLCQSCNINLLAGAKVDTMGIVLLEKAIEYIKHTDLRVQKQDL